MTQIYEQYLRTIHARDWYIFWFGLILPILLAGLIYTLEKHHRAKPVVLGILIGAFGSVIYAIANAA